MRLLLDEHIAPAVAEALRRGGHDVIAVAGRTDLRGLSDREILQAASAQRRVLVTHDVRDFSVLGSARVAPTRHHQGVVLVPRSAFPRSAEAIGRLVRALELLLAQHPADDALLGQVVWLTPPASEPD